MEQILNKLKIDKKRLITNLIILISIFAIGLAIDQGTKYAIFNKYSRTHIANNPFDVIANYKLFGVRLVHNTGMMASLGDHLPFWSVQLITSLIAIPVIVSVLFMKKNSFAVALSLIGVGAMGNIIDRYNTVGHYVMDWIFIPWLDRGTFNMADIFVMSGAMVIPVAMLMSLFEKDKGAK